MAAYRSIRTKPKVSGSSRKHKFESPMDRATGLEMDWKRTQGLFNRARSIDNVSFVYFIGERDGGPLKIGKAKDPIGRLRTMQTGNPRRLKLEHVLLGDVRTEHLLHEIWEPLSIPSDRNKGRVKEKGAGTEWFRPEIRDELLPTIDAACWLQEEVLAKPGEDGVIEVHDLERAVWEAHLEHGCVRNANDPTILLAAGAGTTLRGRGSRVHFWMYEAA